MADPGGVPTGEADRADPGAGADSGLTPLVPGPIHGYRLWRIEDDSLHSLIPDIRWAPGLSLIADCDHAPHQAPSPHCTCGIYAFRMPNWLVSVSADWLGSNLAAGMVALWGRVVEHAEGWRAEEGYPVEVWVPPRAGPADRAALGRLAARYRCRIGRPPAVLRGWSWTWPPPPA